MRVRYSYTFLLLALVILPLQQVEANGASTNFSITADTMLPDMQGGTATNFTVHGGVSGIQVNGNATNYTITPQVIRTSSSSSSSSSVSSSVSSIAVSSAASATTVIENRGARRGSLSIVDTTSSEEESSDRSALSVEKELVVHGEETEMHPAAENIEEDHSETVEEHSAIPPIFVPNHTKNTLAFVQKLNVFTGLHDVEDLETPEDAEESEGIQGDTHLEILRTTNTPPLSPMEQTSFFSFMGVAIALRLLWIFSKNSSFFFKHF